LQFVQRLNLEACLAQKARRLAVGEVEVHRLLGPPLKALHPELGPSQRLVTASSFSSPHRHRQNPVGQRIDRYLWSAKMID
jgi:hypothetical protein